MDLQEHRNLLNRWSARQPHDTESFAFDGPINPDRWLEIPRRVLFLAKEAYRGDQSSENWDLPELVREEWEGPQSNFWWTLGYLAYGIQRLTNGPIPSSPMAGQLWEEVTKSVLASAVVNIKKSGGRSRSDDADLQKYVREDGDLLKQQVKCLRPDVMVCCNTWDLVKDVWPHKHTSEQVYDIDGMLVLDFWHPANRFPAVMNYYTAVVLLHQGLYPC